ncbi:MAG: hypothetical protein M1832_001741 [Thelocarpon impressellum]|nr:MAG: hypothetical protein M1832_001741 [Thelocarpon impressellum]
MPPLLRRALLYVPGSSPRFLRKSRELPGPVDSVAYDLEDSVSPSRKADARAAVAAILAEPRVPGIREQGVRINTVASGLAEGDLLAVSKSPNLDTVIVPKVNSAADLRFVADVLRHALPSASPAPTQSRIQILALVETARALSSLPSICASTPLLTALIFGAEDFALDLSLTRTPGLAEMLLARSAIVTAARAADLRGGALDLVCTAYRGAEGRRVLAEECHGGRGLGFAGKQCVHPDQVDVVQAAFAPAEAEAAWAVRLLVAAGKAEERGRGAWALDGKMVDAPVVGKARAVVERAKACGFDLAPLQEKWRDQEPE